MKKLSLREKKRIFWGLLWLSTLLYLIGCLGSMVLLILGFCGIVGATVLGVAWIRCPYCGALLLRGHRDGDYCAQCGKRVFWDNHDLPEDKED